MILTIDLGTSVTKVTVWSEAGMIGLARTRVETSRPQLGWAEQDPGEWWSSLVAAGAALRREVPTELASVEALVLTGARQTFVPVARNAGPIGPAILWSDRRAGAEAAALAGACGGYEAVRQRTGVALRAEAVAAKVAWLAAHQPGRLSDCDWLLSARDLVLWWLTGEVATDPSMASCTGLADLDGDLYEELAGPATGHLAAVVPSTEIVGRILPEPAAALGVRPGAPVVVGAGDRQCEVIGAGASADHPMVSWGTTANVSVPRAEVPQPVPGGTMVSRGATGDWLLEAGLSAAGSWLAWLARLTGRTVHDLVAIAGDVPPGARGVVAVPWLDGARAPWWSDDARAGFVGLGSDHGPSDLARAAIESVAWDVRRCLDAVTGARPPVGLAVTGSNGVALWVDVLTAITGLPARRRRSGQAASVGAALLAAAALQLDWDIDRLDPVIEAREPDGALVARYASIAGRAASIASTLVTLPPPPPTEPR